MRGWIVVQHRLQVHLLLQAGDRVRRQLLQRCREVRQMLWRRRRLREVLQKIAAAKKIRTPAGFFRPGVFYFNFIGAQKMISSGE